MREIVFDTETTGLDPLNGDRICEIGCVELFNHIPTGQTFHAYINPQRSMPTAASAVHGLTDEFLENKPMFAQIVDDFLEFIGASPLIIHNAAFDIGFINAELTRHGFKILPMTRATDTVAMARRMFPGAPASLDALCKRFNIDTSARELHGALLDARLLAEVYLELKGGRQPDLVMAGASSGDTAIIEIVTREFRAPREHAPTDEELAMHEAFLALINEPLWKSA